MIIKNNSCTEGFFYRIDKNINNGKPTKRKIVETGKGSRGVTIPPILIDMLNSLFVEIDFNINKDGSLKEITIKPIKDSIEKNS